MTRVLCEASALRPGHPCIVGATADRLHGGTIVLRLATGAVVAYRNACPHMGVPLDWDPARLLDASGRLVCTGHDARFRATDGLCLRGPCEGERLQRVPVRVQDGVVLADG